ncbi:hypothetical protein ATE67_14880 [Sphingopyxis sp. H050]|uniref:hypothetical protein n=1 Tax=Sphingopyxis sp. H050 TaxID=1759072 RepID=UPI0007378519|nr:hypothetical protein [Sphingopyxis sp. H050]KTE19285.1 hypothetical protein ATE67_14880 [Sphingopyxis sp. H050]
MKTIFAVAAFAAATLATPVFAQDATGGHYEWQARQVPGPNKSGIAPRVRVWVKDAPMQMADCHCDMMKASPGDCMKKMSGDHMMPSEG